MDSNSNQQLLKLICSIDGSQQPGYTDMAQYFAQKTGVDVEQVNVAALPWPLEDNSVGALTFLYSLEHFGSEDPNSGLPNLVDYMREIERVCCEGAYIQIATISSQFASLNPEMTVARIITEENIQCFNRNIIENTIAQVGDKLDENVRTKLLSINTNLHCLNIFKQQTESANDANDSIHLANIYTLTPVKNPDDKFDYALAKVQDTLPFVMQIYNPEKGSMFVSRAIKERGIHEPVETIIYLTAIHGFLKRFGSVRIANIGANIGWYSIIAGLVSEQVSVDAFEPGSDNVTILKNNVFINNLSDRVKVYDIAVSSKKGNIEFVINKDNAGSSCIVRNDAKQEDEQLYEHIQVETNSLDNMYLDNKDKQPHIILMDVEGADQQVFDGATKLFEQGFRPLIMLEFSPSLLSRYGETSYYIDLCEKYGYTPWLLRRDGKGLLVKTNCEELKELYNNLADPEQNPQEKHADILFTPDYVKHDDNSISF